MHFSFNQALKYSYKFMRRVAEEFASVTATSATIVSTSADETIANYKTESRGKPIYRDNANNVGAGSVVGLQMGGVLGNACVDGTVEAFSDATANHPAKYLDSVNSDNIDSTTSPVLVGATTDDSKRNSLAVEAPTVVDKIASTITNGQVLLMLNQIEKSYKEGQEVYYTMSMCL